MNSKILNNDIQEYIDANLNADVTNLLLAGIKFTDVDTLAIIEQIEAKKRSEKKLPTWFNTTNIYFPNKLNIEQTSSEITAKYKASLVNGDSLIDLTGGLGIDAFYFSKTINKVTHCEINHELSDIVNYNFTVLGTNNITCIAKNGIDYLKQLDKDFDYIYLDPSRRDPNKQKVFLISDCKPDVTEYQSLFLKFAKHIIIKTSPLLDLSATLKDLKNVSNIHIVAVNNEVKELLWFIERNYKGSPTIKTINIRQKNTQKFEFNFTEEPLAEVVFSYPQDYIYEPNAAILKAGAFNSISEKFNIGKLHRHSHLYTSGKLINFPGRRFKIIKQLPFNRKLFAKEKINKANITTRNFPLSVNAIRNKLKIKDGGDNYLFFTTNIDNEKIILICSKT